MKNTAKKFLLKFKIYDSIVCQALRSLAETSLLVMLLLMAGCSHSFVRVGHKYNSIHHLRFSESHDVIRSETKDLVLVLDNLLRSSGASVLELKQVNTKFQPDSTSDKCWDAIHEILTNEWGAFRTNDFDAYEEINRLRPFEVRGISNDCALYQTVSGESPQTWMIRAQLSDRRVSRQYSIPNVDIVPIFGTVTVGNTPVTYSSTTMVSSQTTATATAVFGSYIEIYAWPSQNPSETELFLIGWPLIDGIQSCIGCSVGYLWWPEVDGRYEALTVRNMLTALKTMEMQGIFQKPVADSPKDVPPKKKKRK